MNRRRDVVLTAGLGVLAFAVAVGTLSAFAGHDADQRSNPFVAEPGPGHRAATASAPDNTPSDTAQAAPLAPPSESPSASPRRTRRPTPIRTGRWTGIASLTVTGTEIGCTATTRTFRRPATLRIDPPLPSEDNAVHVSFRSDRQSVEGAFEVVSAVPGPPPIGYWTLSGDSTGGLIGSLSAPAANPVQDRPPVDNVFYAVRSLDQQCGALLSAPLSFPMASGTALRTTLAGKHASIRITGQSSDNTRTFQIVFAS